MSPRQIHENPVVSLARTRHDAAQALQEAGIDPQAAERLLAEGARTRHVDRVRAHVRHALDAAIADEGLVGMAHEEAPPEVVALAIGLLLLDAVGPVPRPGERAPRVRHRAFKHSCGPIVGETAPVTQAAAHAAVLALSRRIGAPTPEIVLEPLDGAIGVVVSGVGARTVGLLRVNPSERHDCQPCGWMIRAAREGLDRAVGLERSPGLPEIRIRAERTAEDHRIGRHPLDHLYAFGRDAGAWGALWTRATAQERLEKTLSKWAQVIADLPAGEEQAPPPIVGADDRRPSMARAFAWIDQLELPSGDRQAIAHDLAMGQLHPSALEDRLRSALQRYLRRVG